MTDDERLKQIRDFVSPGDTKTDRVFLLAEIEKRDAEIAELRAQLEWQPIEPAAPAHAADAMERAREVADKFLSPHAHQSFKDALQRIAFAAIAAAVEQERNRCSSLCAPMTTMTTRRGRARRLMPAN